MLLRRGKTKKNSIKGSEDTSRLRKMNAFPSLPIAWNQRQLGKTVCSIVLAAKYTV